MSVNHSTKVVTDDLILYYDRENTKRSWLGKPTENLISLSGADASLERSGTSYPYFSADITSLVQSRWSPTNNKLSMSFEGRRDYVQGGTGGGGDGYPSMYIYFTDWSWASSFGTGSYEWSQATQNNITMPDPTGKSVYFSIYHMNAGNPGISYSRNHQVEFGTFATPFVNGTRSNANALVDLSGQNTITATQLTYTSDNKFSFGGQGEQDGSPTGDYITIPTSVSNTSSSVKPNGCTYSWWSKITAAQPYGQCILFGASTIAHIEFKGEGTSSPYFRTEAVTENGYSFGTGTIPGGSLVGRWVNFTIVFANNEPNRPVRWYHNGELFYTGSMTGGINPSTEHFYFSGIGRATGDATYLYSNSFLGEVPLFQIYNKSLSAQEIQQNFNALRGRFSV